MVRVWPLIASLLLLAPLATAQEDPGIYNPWESTDTTLYVHLSGMQDAMINTQKPDDRYAQSASWGVATHTSCVEDPTGAQTFTESSYHTYYARATPSIVQYDVDQGGYPRVHPERGISFDVHLDTQKELYLTWVLESQVFAGDEGPVPADPNEAPVVVPNVAVRGTLREGVDISVNNEALNTGKLVAQGQTPATLLAQDATEGDHVTYHNVDGRHLYEFRFPLDYEAQTIGRDEAFNLRVDVFMENGYCDEPEDENSLMMDWLRVHTSPAFRPKMELSIMNPIVIEALHPQFVGDELIVHTGSNSPWGSYDVLGDLPSDPGAMELSIEGPTPALSLEQLVLKDTALGHDHHQEAVTAVWAWDYRSDQAQDGIYTVKLRVQNDQETAEAVAIATFQIGDGTEEVCAKNFGDEDVTCIQPDQAGGREESPGLPLLGLVVALAGIAAVRRRR